MLTVTYMNKKENELAYKVGGLLYTPASNADHIVKLIETNNQFLTSIALCLEDAIQDTYLKKAEEEIKKALLVIKNNQLDCPLLFIRVRNPQHMDELHSYLGELEQIITGYILPKFDLSNCDEYCKLIKSYNYNLKRKIYIMPILETKSIADCQKRINSLTDIKAKLEPVKQYVLNIRVGGNDFCNIYGIRRSVKSNIYQIGVISNILSDIINVFSDEYVVSGPVWEYFGNDNKTDWANGLKNELKYDRLNGFIGKTAIHPSQIPIIYESLKVDRNDYEDAINVIHWNDKNIAVSKSASEDRMNEQKCHITWANQILTLAKIYGIKDN